MNKRREALNRNEKKVPLSTESMRLGKVLMRFENRTRKLE